MALFNVIVLIFICMEFFIKEEEDGKIKETTFKAALQNIGVKKEGEEVDTETI